MPKIFKPRRKKLFESRETGSNGSAALKQCLNGSQMGEVPWSSRSVCNRTICDERDWLPTCRSSLGIGLERFSLALAGRFGISGRIATIILLASQIQRLQRAKT